MSDETTAVVERKEPGQEDANSIAVRAAEAWGLPDAKRVIPFMLATVVKGTKNYKPTATDCAHVLLVAMNYRLNPFTKEIHAFVDKGRIIPVIGVDGWARIANANGFDGSDVSFGDCLFEHGSLKDRKLPESCTVSVYVKGRSNPVTVTEYMEECYVPPRNNYPGPWQSHPRRMLRHKAFIQACRIAFSIAGVYDEDEAKRIIDGEVVAVEPQHDPLLDSLQENEIVEEVTA